MLINNHSMKRSILLIVSLLLISHLAISQRAFTEITGMGDNGITLDVDTGQDSLRSGLVAIRGTAHPRGALGGYGVGGIFTGGSAGAECYTWSPSYYALFAHNYKGIGLLAKSSEDHGAAFLGADGKASILLRGSDYFGGDDDGVIMTDPMNPNGDMALVSYDDVVIQLDKNGGENGFFKIQDGKRDNTNDGHDVFRVRDNGNVDVKALGVNVFADNKELGDITIVHKEIPSVVTNGAEDFLSSFVGLHIINEKGASHLHADASLFAKSNRLYLAGGLDRKIVGHFDLDSGVYTSLGSTSDVRLKKNIVDHPDVLAALMDVGIKKYQLKGSYDRVQIGFIAQEILKYFPELVNFDGEHYSLNYDRFGVLAIKGIQEQQEKINSLESQLASLKKEFRSFVANSTSKNSSNPTK